MEQSNPAPHRPLIMGTQQAVSTGHYLATMVAMRILDRGGNAVDAGVAAGLCLGVLYPDMDKITSLGSYPLNGPPGYAFKVDSSRNTR